MHTHTHSRKRSQLYHCSLTQRVEFPGVAVNSCWQFWTLLNINTSYTLNSVFLCSKDKWRKSHFANVFVFDLRSNDDDC